MNVQGIEITPEQEAAGIAAMVGEFRAHDVRRALVASGVVAGRPADYLVERVADRLMQRERRAHRIRAVTNKLWVKTA